MPWDLCIMDTLELIIGALIIQISLYDQAPFGTITKCVDCAGVLIFKCPD